MAWPQEQPPRPLVLCADSGRSHDNEARPRWTLKHLQGSRARITNRAHLDGDGPVAKGAARDQVRKDMPMLPLVLSSDSHVFEPPDLWQTRIDAAFRDRAPRNAASIRVCHRSGGSNT